jgi:uncharacterized membrane protein YkvA (DUF1232 family)
MRDRYETRIEIWKRAAGKLKEKTYALYLAYKHPQTPWYARVFAGLVVAYAFSPIDLVPDFIPVLGYLDDLILVPLGIWLVLKLIPFEVMEECRVAAQTRFDEDKPGNTIAGVIIVLVWVCMAGLCLAWLVRLF